MIEKIDKTLDEWRMILTPEQFRITRLGENEVQFTGKYDKFHKEGKYVCVCCGNKIFGSKGKYKEGTGWPNFFMPYGPESVEIWPDKKTSLNRKEVICAKCEAHLGYLYESRKSPTGKNFSINSVALHFVPQKSGERPDEYLV